MSIDVADLLVTLTADNTVLQSGLDDATQLVEKAAQDIGDQGDQAGAAFGEKFSDQFAKFGTVAGKAMSTGLSIALGDVGVATGTYNNPLTSLTGVTKEVADHVADLRDRVLDTVRLISESMAPGFEKIATDLHVVSEDALRFEPLIADAAEASVKLAENVNKTGEAFGVLKDKTSGMDELINQMGLTMDGASSAFERSFQNAFAHIQDGWEAFLTGFVQSFARAVQQMASQYLSSQLANVLFGVNGILGGAFGGQGGDGSGDSIVAGNIGGSGGIAGIVNLLGDLFQGLFAGGGDFTGGKAMIVGENGPELLVPRGAGSVIPSNGLGGIGGAPTIINMNVHVPSIAAAGTRETQSQVARAYKLMLMKESFRS